MLSQKKWINPNVKLLNTVSFDDGKNEIVFYKSNLSARWWMGVPFKNLDSSNLDYYLLHVHTKIMNKQIRRNSIMDKNQQAIIISITIIII